MGGARLPQQIRAGSAALSAFVAVVLLAACQPVDGSAASSVPLPTKSVPVPPVETAPYPYAVIVDGGPARCVGTIISDSWVLTAAHCADSDSISSDRLQVDGKQVLGEQVAAFRSGAQDVAVLRVAAGTFADVPSVALAAPDFRRPVEGTPATILWTGAQVAGGGRALGIMAESTVVDTGGDLAAGSPGHTVCSGSGGGPLLVTIGGIPTQIGVNTKIASSCDGVAQFAELSNVTLTWLMYAVPGINRHWDPCPVTGGGSGEWFGTYHLERQSKDGPPQTPPGGGSGQAGTGEDQLPSIGPLVDVFDRSCKPPFTVNSMAAVAAGANVDGRLALFSTADGIAYRAWTPAAGRAWSGWYPVVGQVDAIAVAGNADGRLQLFGANEDDLVFQCWQLTPGGSVWSNWVQLDGQVHELAAATNADGRVELFGTNGNGRVFHRWQLSRNGTDWSSWVGLDGSVRSIAATRDSTGRLNLFGVNDGGRVFVRSQIDPNSQQWSSWIGFDGSLKSIAAVTNVDGRMELFGSNSDGRVFHQRQLQPGGSAWSGWMSFDGAVKAIAATVDNDGRVHLYGVNDDGHAFERAQTSPNGTTWSAFTEVPTNWRLDGHDTMPG